MPPTIGLVHGAFAESSSWNAPTDPPSHSATQRPIALDDPGSGSPDHPTWGDVFDQTSTLSGAASYGPPFIFLLGPWLLLVLLLIGPFALIVTLLLALAIAACLLAVCTAVIASPYLLIRHLRNQGTGRAKPRPSLRLVRDHRVSIGRLGSLQSKGVS